MRQVFRAFMPVFISRGIVQLSAYVDQIISTWLPIGAPAAIQNAQLLSTLPVSLFGMAVSAAELPAMSRVTGDEAERFALLRARLDNGLRQIAFFVVPSAVAFLALGDVVAAALFQTGRFSHGDSVYVWQILAGSAVGLLASTLGPSVFVDVLRAARHADAAQLRADSRRDDDGLRLFLCAAAAEAARRRSGVGRRGTDGVGRDCGLDRDVHAAPDDERADREDGTAGVFGGDALGIGSCRRGRGVGIRLVLPPLHPILAATFVLGPYGLVYFGIATMLKVPEAASVFGRLRRLV